MATLTCTLSIAGKPSSVTYKCVATYSVTETASGVTVKLTKVARTFSTNGGAAVGDNGSATFKVGSVTNHTTGTGTSGTTTPNTSTTVNKGNLSSTVTLTLTYRNETATANVSVAALAKPSLTIRSAARCTSNGTLSDEGTYARVTCSWSAATAAPVTWSCSVGPSSTTTPSSSSTAQDGKSGTATFVVGGSLGVNNAYNVSVTVTSTTSGGTTGCGSTTRTTSIGSTAYPIDASPAGNVGIGCVAADDKPRLKVSNAGGYGIEADGVSTFEELKLDTPLATAQGGTGSTDFGTLLTESSDTSTSVSTSTYRSVGKVELSAGTWVLTYGVSFPSNSTGRRVMSLNSADADPSTTYIRATGASTNAVVGGGTYLHGSFIVRVSSASAYYLMAWQNSGGSLSCNSYIRAFKLQ